MMPNMWSFSSSAESILFEILIDTHRSCCPQMNSLFNWRDSICYIFISKFSVSLSIYLLMSFFSVPGPHLGYFISFSCYISLAFPCQREFSRFSLFLVTLKILRNTGKVFLQNVPLVKFINYYCVFQRKTEELP